MTDSECSYKQGGSCNRPSGCYNCQPHLNPKKVDKMITTDRDGNAWQFWVGGKRGPCQYDTLIFMRGIGDMGRIAANDELSADLWMHIPEVAPQADIVLYRVLEPSTANASDLPCLRENQFDAD